MAELEEDTLYDSTCEERYKIIMSSHYYSRGSDGEEEEEEEEDFVAEGLLREDSVPFKSKAEWQTLTPDDLSKKMFEIVDDVNDVFQVRDRWVWFNDYPSPFSYPLPMYAYYSQHVSGIKRS